VIGAFTPVRGRGSPSTLLDHAAGALLFVGARRSDRHNRQLATADCMIPLISTSRLF
jgi:hypothetical protein